MLRLNVDQLLKSIGRTRYWLAKQLDVDYSTAKNLAENKTTGIRFDTIEKLCRVFKCEPGDLFRLEHIEEETEKE